MTSLRILLMTAAAVGFAAAAPVLAQDAAAPATAPAAPAGAAAPAEAAPAAAPAAQPAVPATAPAAAPAPAPAAPAQPQIQVTKQGDWEIGCVAGTTNCEMQQVALDPTKNPVVLARVIKLPAGADAQALMIFNTPLGTLLHSGLSFQIDNAQAAVLPFEWCVQEGCVVRLGLREPDVAAMKRGNAIKLIVTSIASPQTPVVLNLSLAGFTAGFDSLAVPPAPPAPAAPAAPAVPAPAPANQ
ncbi:invasion associated locus B family protein [Amaricoccus sp.]|uniref:invasion associated locus B family protein n=1 Tax=Amaricoccus sp. TaxID=1872485 RepID=UPI001B6893C3|nr:invasion associated locus B family protein [Amaricoccus sp.]MBP6999904.1 invasion associated locus B family protein [Amaricoccus sp.]